MGTDPAAQFRAAFRAIPALVAQWIERRFPKPCVAGSIPAGGAQAKNLPTDGPGLTDETEYTSDFRN